MSLEFSTTLPPVAAERTPDYAVLFQREFPKVVRTVYLVVRDHGRAEELAQEAFVQLLMHWKKVSGYDRPEAWVRRVAIRLAIRSSTRERLRSVLERRAVVEPPPGRVSTCPRPSVSCRRPNEPPSSCTTTRIARLMRWQTSWCAR